MEFEEHKKLEVKENYPYIINKLIRMLQRNGIHKLIGIQTKIFTVIRFNEQIATECTMIKNIVDIEIDEDVTDSIFILYTERDGSLTRFNIKFEAIIGFKEAV